jgi:2-oxoglutarate dehydrogenase E2 component (dihydrolipoamide succinyltransferase)
MAIAVKIPAMGESISSGILATWHVKDGQFVEEGQVLFELETDKITSEASAEQSGVIALKVKEGDEVEIGQVVAEIDADAKNTGASKPASATPKEKPAQSPEKTSSAKNSPTAEDAVEDVAAVQGTHYPLSPAARRAAEETGVDPIHIQGSGKDGRITKGDVLAAAEAATHATSGKVDKVASVAAVSPAKAPVAQPISTTERETRRKMSPLRKKIAERLVTATQQAALLTTFNEVDMSAVMELRKIHQDAFVQRHGVKLGFMSFFVKATTQALMAVPAVNARIEDDTIVSQHYYDIGVAVGTDKGLMVPVVHDCERKSFATIEQDILNYAKAAREGKIKMEDLQGGVFTISNGGIYGSMLSTPIINYPQPAILGLHNIQSRPVVRNGQIVARPMMYLALSYDHRLIDGKEAVTFLTTIKDAIEDPSRLLFEL